MRLRFLLPLALCLLAGPAFAQETSDPAPPPPPTEGDGAPPAVGEPVTSDLPVPDLSEPEPGEGESTASAQVSGRMSYQGFLEDGSGPVNGSVNFTFGLYGFASGGTALWTETQNGIQVTDGAYQVRLGSVTSLPASIFEDPVYLQVTVGSTVLTPRTELTPAPAAYVAKSVELPYSATSDWPFAVFEVIASSATGDAIRGQNGSNVGYLGESAAGVFASTADETAYGILASTSVNTSAGYFVQTSSSSHTAPALHALTTGAEAGRFTDGRVAVYEGNFQEIELDPDVNGGGEIELFDDGERRMLLRAADNSFGGAGLYLYGTDDTNTLELDANDAGSAGALYARVPGGGEGARLLGARDGSLGGELRLYQRAASGTGPTGALLLAEENDSEGGALFLNNGAGTNTIKIDAQEGSQAAGQITMYDLNGDSSIEIDGSFNGIGRVTTGEVEVTGGSDFAELFDVSGTAAPQPGYIVSIDPAEPGQLLVASEAYDRKVAGVVSGAGGVRPGLVMGQDGSLADGETPVALTGRVYVWASTENGPIQPGDLLTSSSTPGHAMRATDPARAFGATIGKAMSGLDAGEGLVLLLVQF
ncbi:MAG: hypothetical protein AAGI08_02195 [Bacteroidota bacterium]